MSNIQLTGLIRFALHFPGEKRTIETGRVIDGEREKREVTKANIIYGEWSGGSFHPVQNYKDVVAGAERMEIHRKIEGGKIEVVYWEKNPEKIKLEWLAFSAMATDSTKVGKLPVYIRGLRVTSPEHGVKQFMVVEGI